MTDALKLSTVTYYKRTALSSSLRCILPPLKLVETPKESFARSRVKYFSLNDLNIYNFVGIKQNYDNYFENL